MKRISRNPIKFEVFAAFALLAKQRGLSIQDPQTLQQFQDAVRDQTENSLDNAAFIYGQRTEAMFETVVVSLGKVKLLKQEDAGNAYFHGDFALPDYRLVLDNGEQLLVEVKDYYQKQSLAPFKQKVACLREWEAYAAVTSAELLIAVYWGRSNMWTLVSPKAFVIDGEFAKLNFSDAIKANQMRRLGDYRIGLRSPLRFQVEVEELDRDGNERLLKVRQVKLISEDQVISDPVESRIAFMAMFYGSWSERVVPEERDSKIVAIEYQYAPEDARRFQDEQGFDFVDPISSMVSKFYRQGTAQDGRVNGFHVDFTPGKFGRLIPKDYFEHEHTLQLWRFELQHSEAGSALIR